MAFTQKQNVKNITQTGNNPRPREIRRKDDVASRKTWITWTVKNSSAVILHRACVGSARPEPALAELWECLCIHCITSDVHRTGLSLPVCSDRLGDVMQSIWLCRTSSRCELTLHKALWGWLLLAFVDPEIYKSTCWLCHCSVAKVHEIQNHSVSELGCSLDMYERLCLNL